MLNQRLHEIQVNQSTITLVQYLHDLIKAYGNLSECTDVLNNCYGLVALVIN